MEEKDIINRKAVVKKWKDSGLLDGFNKPKMFEENMSKLFEAQNNQTIVEDNNDKELPFIPPVAIRAARQIKFNWMDMEMIKLEIDEDRIMF
jgi:macrodomain Ter protein organizer (MatP/YcbG family)